jgi:microcystin-dependent protein
MATLTNTPIRTFVSGETVTPTKLNELAQSTVALTAGTIVSADIASDAVTTAKILDANVTTVKLAAVTAQALLPAGAVMPFAMNSAPSGWLAADGTAVSRSTYATLFAAISTAHGAGDGSTTFNLPDLRGIFVRGSSSQTISGTAYTGTFGAKQNDAIDDHNHSVKYNTYGVNAGSSTAVTILNSAGANTYNVAMQSGTAGTETRPANIALLYCIKF